MGNIERAYVNAAPVRVSARKGCRSSFLRTLAHRSAAVVFLYIGANGGSLPHAAALTTQRIDSIWTEVSRRHRLDVLTLYAIAFNESRRLSARGIYRPWPWTLRTAKEGAMYFDSYEAASRKLAEIIASGVSNVDVGVMQVNWGWHGHRLHDPSKLLRPANNIEVAGSILREALDACAEDLRCAFGRYHTYRAQSAAPYAEAVLTTLRHLQRMKGLRASLTSTLVQESTS